VVSFNKCEQVGIARGGLGGDYAVRKILFMPFLSSLA
jgi:hypothetical protein